jgi:hypothetical protein
MHEVLQVTGPHRNGTFVAVNNEPEWLLPVLALKFDQSILYLILTTLFRSKYISFSV